MAITTTSHSTIGRSTPGGMSDTVAAPRKDIANALIAAGSTRFHGMATLPT